MNEDELLRLWRRAAESEFGIIIKTDDFRKLQNELYKARKGHEQFMSMQICAVGGDAWLVKPVVEDILDASRPGRADSEDQS
jgi:hypothetical protein